MYSSSPQVLNQKEGSGVRLISRRVYQLLGALAMLQPASEFHVLEWTETHRSLGSGMIDCTLRDVSEPQIRIP